MSDLSLPPLEFTLDLDHRSLAPGAARAAEPAAAGGAGAFEWPTPALPSYPAPSRMTRPLSCEIEGHNGSRISGRLMHFNAAAGMVHVHVASSRATLPLRFNQFRALRLVDVIAPLPPEPDDTTPMALTERRVTHYRVTLKSGQVLEGETLTHDEDQHGLFLFEPVDSAGSVVRLFVPRVAYQQVDIGARLGEQLVEDRATTPEQVIAALDEQETLRNRKLGEVLMFKQLITPAELEQAIEEQARMPMVRIGQALTALGYITEAQLEQALAQQDRDRGIPLGELLVQRGAISRGDLQTALARKMGYPFVDVTQFDVETEALKKLPYAVASRVQALPLILRGGRLVVAMEDPSQRKLVDEIEFAAGCKAIPVIARANTLAHAIDRHYEKVGGDVGALRLDPTGAIEFTADSANKLLATLESDSQAAAQGADDDGGAIEQADNSLVRLINSMILEAQAQGVSDIHIESSPGKEKVRIRFRKDGAMYPYMELPHNYRTAIVARVKIMCDLDIAERRKPQDGKITFGRFVQGQKLELRVATIPTFGNCEDVVLRLLASAKPLPLAKIALSPHNIERLEWAIGRPYGMILCVGPTGSGKTTTLHSALGAINTPERKIWTAEDPIEITQPGLRQVQVNAKIDWTFERALRAFLRADPDVIMVGEIRDKETASTAIEASLTGHLVLSTLHTNSAAETVTRLLDMGMDPFNFADALLVVLAQRLVRRICSSCRTSNDARPEQIDEWLGDYMHQMHGVEDTPAADDVLASWRQRFGQNGRLQYHHAGGCSACEGTGLKGRAGLHELLHVTPIIRKQIQTGARAEEILQSALAAGMRTLRQDGIEKVISGLTTLGEVRATTNM